MWRNVEHEGGKIVTVKSAENDSNILVKNPSGELHKKHSKMTGEKLK